MCGAKQRYNPTVYQSEQTGGWTWELASAQCVPCSYELWMHQGMQKTVQGRLDVHSVVQVWWMLIMYMLHTDTWN